MILLNNQHKPQFDLHESTLTKIITSFVMYYVTINEVVLLVLRYDADVLDSYLNLSLLSMCIYIYIYQVQINSHKDIYTCDISYMSEM